VDPVPVLVPVSAVRPEAAAGKNKYGGNAEMIQLFVNKSDAETPFDGDGVTPATAR
jgi:hypothetical protein